MSDVTAPKVPPAYDGYKKLVCPFLPCERAGNQLTPTMCVGPACAVYMRITNEVGHVISGECGIRMTAGQVANLVTLLATREQQRGTPPIIRPV